MNTNRYCPRCGKAKLACICTHLLCINNPYKVIVLQHPDETKHPMGTARILALCLSQCEIWISADPDALPQLQDLISDNNSLCFLLYPANDALMASPSVINSHFIQASGREVVFILLDASWRKAYGLLAGSQLLQKMIKLTLPADLESAYRVRATKVKGGLSTVEAAAHLLSAIEGKTLNQTPYHSLISILDKMVDFQLAAMPANVRLRYSK